MFLRVSVMVFQKLLHTERSSARLLLNYKELPYKTEWIDLVDIAPTLESYGIKPNPPQTMGASVGTRYTLPAVQLPDKSFVMDSVSIAIELESRYPEPSLYLDAASYEEAQGLVFKCALPLFPVREMTGERVS